MALSNPDLIEIVERSSTLTERLAERFESAHTHHPKAKARLARWGALAPMELERWFPKWAQADKHDLGAFRLLGAVILPAGSPLPTWAALLGDLSVSIQSASTTSAVRGQNRLPFAHLFMPMVSWAGARARSSEGFATKRLAHSAWTDLEGGLASRLSGICSLALQSDFLAYSALRNPRVSVGLFSGNAAADCAGSIYSRFVQDQIATGLSGFFKRYPTAGRLCGRLIEDWTAFVREFQQRVEEDFDEIIALCCCDDVMPRVLRIKTGISDPHRHGRTALILTLSGKRQIVYKPRSIEAEAAFSALLARLNEKPGFLPQKTLRILPKGEYGWMEFAEFSPCKNTAALRRFYRRAGALLAILHAFRGTDVHRENIVAAGEFPVIVDLETLCHPDIPGQRTPGEAPADTVSIGSTVLRTNFLPLHHKAPGTRRLIDVSGLRSPINLRSAVPGLRWKNVNSDRMQVSPTEIIRVCRTHRPSCRNVLPKPEHYIEAIVKGFTSAANAMSKDQFNRDFQVSCERIQAAPTRLVARPTIVYNAVLLCVNSPLFLGDGVDRSIELRVLPESQDINQKQRWQSEIEDLENLDIPHLIAEKFSIPQLTMMSKSDAAHQAKVIRLSFVERLVSEGGLAIRPSNSR